MEWAGPERGIVQAVAARPGVKFLYWYDAVGDIDLTATHLGTVRLTGDHVRRVQLPNSTETLMLRKPHPMLAVDAPEVGRRLDLRLFWYGPDVVIPAGLSRTPQLWLWVGGEVSATVLSTLTDLEQLTLTFDGPPGCAVRSACACAVGKPIQRNRRYYCSARPRPSPVGFAASPMEESDNQPLPARLAGDLRSDTSEFDAARRPNRLDVRTSATS